MRLGLYGGTFDPPHRAHLAVALAAREALRLDQCRLVPCGTPPLKPGAVAAAGHRLAMCRLLAAGWAGLIVDDRELRRTGVSFTADTLAELAAEQPGDWWLVVGADALADLPRWRSPERILRLARIAVAARPGYPLEAVLANLPAGYAERVDPIELAPIEGASSAVRRALRSAGEAAELTPEIAAYVAEHRLYQDA